ncbi:GNAT family N-acetyltransferase [uncultured Pseudoteredinibacter sp.]|uniref:GNAT family N-acetyltransferase n=1 Tax=uncultured Pseudoteredinibacter sp. TaxID=1641701 RepID=UPI0026139CEF|nr:GNAT family N-acetyltransferase [uncultured Pseudoteredinibacter sp.]
MKFKVPEQLETERLILRQFKDEDWQDLHEYYSSEEATRYTVGRAFSEGESWRIMSAMLGHWVLRGYGPYALEEKSSSKVIGTAGFWYPNDWPSPEIKWALAPAHWGKGYAGEAARALQKAGLEYLPEIALISLIAKENQASIKLALAVGASFEREIDFRGDRWDIYRHPVA